MFTLFLSALFKTMGVIKILSRKTKMCLGNLSLKYQNYFPIQNIEQMLYDLHFKILVLASNWNDLKKVSMAPTQE